VYEAKTFLEYAYLAKTRSDLQSDVISVKRAALPRSMSLKLSPEQKPAGPRVRGTHGILRPPKARVTVTHAESTVVDTQEKQPEPLPWILRSASLPRIVLQSLSYHVK
jgi:hypothetical protein